MATFNAEHCCQFSFLHRSFQFIRRSYNIHVNGFSSHPLIYWIDLAISKCIWLFLFRSTKNRKDLNINTTTAHTVKIRMSNAKQVCIKTYFFFNGCTREIIMRIYQHGFFMKLFIFLCSKIWTDQYYKNNN